MKALKRAVPFAIGAMLLATGAQATMIDFGTPSSPIYNNTDPTVGVVSFSAGTDDLVTPVFRTTWVADDVTPGNNYLTSGVADGTGISPSDSSAFIGVGRSDANKFGLVSLDFFSIYYAPPNFTIRIDGYLGSVLVGSSSVAIHNQLGSAVNGSISLDLSSTASGADRLFIYDSAVNDTFGIDNFSYSDYVSVCTGPNCGGSNVPEPTSLLLLGAGLLGLKLSKRRKAA